MFKKFIQRYWIVPIIASMLLACTQQIAPAASTPDAPISTPTIVWSNRPSPYNPYTGLKMAGAASNNQAIFETQHFQFLDEGSMKSCRTAKSTVTNIGPTREPGLGSAAPNSTWLRIQHFPTGDVGIIDVPLSYDPQDTDHNFLQWEGYLFLGNSNEYGKTVEIWNSNGSKCLEDADPSILPEYRSAAASLPTPMPVPSPFTTTEYEEIFDAVKPGDALVDNAEYEVCIEFSDCYYTVYSSATISFVPEGLLSIPYDPKLLIIKAGNEQDLQIGLVYSVCSSNRTSIQRKDGIYMQGCFEGLFEGVQEHGGGYKFLLKNNTELVINWYPIAMPKIKTIQTLNPLSCLVDYDTLPETDACKIKE